MTNPIRIGVIGSGYWGPNMIRNFYEMPAADLVAVADLNDDRLQHIQKRYPGVHTTKNHRDFFTLNLDAVVVATPPATHYTLAKECLEAGLHVLVEKPLTLDSAHADDLIALAAERDLRLMVGHTFEYNAAVRQLKRIIASGELGDLYYIDAVRVNLGLFQPHLNVMWDLAPHDISILLYLLGQQEQVQVSAQGMACIFPTVHDVAYMHLVFPSGVLAHVRVSWLDPSKTRRITVVGSKKMAVYDDVEPLEKIKVYDKGVEAPPYTDTYGEFQCSYRYGDVKIPRIDFVEPLREECEHFVQSIRTGERPQSDGHVGRNVVRILEMAEQSLHQNGHAHTATLADTSQQLALSHVSEL
jgi:predicted dehydrogenase